jgi:hypothetical protein
LERRHSSPAHDPPTKPLHDPPGDPTYEPSQPGTDPTPNPASDPPREFAEGRSVVLIITDRLITTARNC